MKVETLSEKATAKSKCISLDTRGVKIPTKRWSSYLTVRWVNDREADILLKTGHVRFHN